MYLFADALKDIQNCNNNKELILLQTENKNFNRYFFSTNKTNRIVLNREIKKLKKKFKN